MAYLSFKNKLRISLTTIAALVLLRGSSAAPATFGGIYTAIHPINPSIGHLVDESTMRRAIAEFQSFSGLNATGELDTETTKQMSLPRCGLPDKVFGHSRAKRYVLNSKWIKRQLTDGFFNYPSNSALNYAQVEAEVARAFSVWSMYTDHSFTQMRYGYVEIRIRFEPLDGPSHILAKAELPLSNTPGDVHFDDAEMWTSNSYEGTNNLFQVAVHELGHTLGLGHSSDQSAVMYSFYTKFNPNFHVQKDDLMGIQALYGPKFYGGIYYWYY